MKKIVILRFFIATAVLILICLLTCERGKYPHSSAYLHGKDSLNAAIGIEGRIFASKGFPVGFNYRLFQKYGGNQNIVINIQSPFSDYNNWELLKSGDIDILAVDMSKDTMPSTYIDCLTRSTFITDSIVWYIRKTDSDLQYNINYYLAYFRQQKDFIRLKQQFFKSYITKGHLDNMTQTDVISPYDDIIKQNSHILKWDWRLLAALIYQESRFSMGAHSSKGATGLMQIKQSTAEHYGIYDIFNPSNNVRAGVLHLKHLQKLFQAEGMDSANVVKFTLASYNAGEGRIDECMNFTLSQGKDYRDWENVCRAITLMKNPSDYTSEDQKFRKFSGDETIKYVDDVLSKYEEYLFVVKE